MHRAIEAGDGERVSALLAADASLAGARDAHGVSAILKAIYYRRVALLPLLLGADPPLDIFEAAALKRDDRVRELLAVDPGLASGWSPDGYTPLHLAAFCDAPECARLLLEKGAAPAAVARNPMMVQPLHSAVSSRSQATVRLLLEAGVEVDARQQQGWTPLHGAAHAGDVELVTVLLDAGADRTLVPDSGKDAAALADEAGHAAVVKLLRSNT